jgi:hypothetical protein
MAFLLAAAAVLRFARLDAQSLWIDEIRGIRLAAADSVPALLSGVTDANPPFYFLLLRYWMTLGTSDAVVRLPAVLFGIAGVGLSFVLFDRWLGRGVALIATLLLAVSPMHLWHSQDSRPYTLALLLSATSLWTFRRFVRTPTAGTAAAWVVPTVLALYTHYSCASIVVLENLHLAACVAGRARAARAAGQPWWTIEAPLVRRWVLAQISAAALVMPWAVFQAAHGQVGLAYDRPLAAASLPYTFFVFSLGYSVGPSTTELHLRQDLGTLLPYLPVIAGGAVVFGMLFISGVVAALKRGPDGWLLLGYLVVPLAFAVTLVLALRSLYNVRYAFVALPAYAALLALGWLELRQRMWQIATGVVAVTLTVVSLINYYGDPRFAKADARAAAAVMSTMVRPSDGVILMPGEMPQIFDRYFSRQIDQYRFFHTFWAPEGLIDRESRHVEFSDLLKRHPRIWLFVSRGWEADPDDVLRRYFLSHHDLVVEHDFSGLNLLLFQVNASADARQAT